MTASVWIVSTGCLYEGGGVESVHATRESGMLVVKRLLAENAEFLEYARSIPDPWDMPPMSQKDDPNLWTAGSDFIALREWKVTP